MEFPTPKYTLLSGIGTAIIVLLLAGCASQPTSPIPLFPPLTASGKAQPAAKPGFFTHLYRVTTFTEKSLPRGIPVHIYTAANLNTGAAGKSAPLVIKMYGLTATGTFKKMPLSAFRDDKKATEKLSDTLIDDRQMMLQPDETYSGIQMISPDINYLGIVAMYPHASGKRWRLIYDVSENTEFGLAIGVHACAMTSADGKLIFPSNMPSNSLSTLHCAAPGW